MNQFNISEIWKKSFGTEIPIVNEFSIPTKEIGKVTGVRGAKFYGVDKNGTTHFMPVELDGMVLPYALIDITAKKNIVSTSLVERKGTVKELISTEDYVINIKALLINDEYPEQEVIDWHKVFEKNKSLILRSVKTDIFLQGDDKVIIREIRWPPVAAVEHVQPVDMTLETDLVYTLEIG